MSAAPHTVVRRRRRTTAAAPSGPVGRPVARRAPGATGPSVVAHRSLGRRRADRHADRHSVGYAATAVAGTATAATRADEERVLPLHAATPEARQLVLAAVDHELRTPLSSLIGYVELLLDGEAGRLTEEQALMLQRIDANASRLLVMVTHLLCGCSQALREGEVVDLAGAVVEALGGLDALDARMPRLGG